MSTIPRDDRSKGPSNLFREAQFSADGTTVVTFNEDHHLRSFVLPSDLLDESQQPHNLKPHAEYKSGTNIQSYALYPHFNLQDPSTTLVLTGSNDVPITLRNALHYDTVHGNYRFVNPLTEAHFPPSSLAFINQGQHFLAGSDNIVAAFDCSQNGSESIVKHQLRPGKRSRTTQVDPWTMIRKGRATALSVSNDGLLAVGTTQREIGLYSDEGMGECTSVFTVDGEYGDGVTSLKWSPDGTYLLVAERQSESIQVYDVRKLQRRVACLFGRRADTPQRLGMDVITTMNGCEVWAGGTDGGVRMWANPGSKEGVVDPDAELKLHESTVSSCIWHPTGAVMATCSGERYAWKGDEDEKEENVGVVDLSAIPDNSLKIWTV